MNAPPLPGSGNRPPRTLNCFSVDVEEYFHCEAFARTVSPGDWPQLQRRALPFVEHLAERLAESGNRATFFVLGWMVAHAKPLFRRLHAAGHEIACHGQGHAHLSRLTPAEFRADLRESRDRIADVIGAALDGYRAPTFSITHQTAWAAEIILEEGFTYDSSIFPIRHDRYGVPGAPTCPFWLETAGGSRLLELPPMTLDMGLLRLPVGGGGYLRLLPGALVRSVLRRRNHRGQASMLYVHPWEFDVDQPQLPAPPISRWRHRLNLATTAGKVDRLLTDFLFDTARLLATAVRRMDLPRFLLSHPARRLAKAARVTVTP